MEKILTGDLQPGMITASRVVTPNGQVIIQRGVTLDKRLIARLNFYSIDHVMVEDIDVKPVDVPEEKVELPEFAKDTTSAFTYSVNPKFQKFQLAYSQKIVQLKEDLNKILITPDFDSKKFLVNSLDELTAEKLTPIELFDTLHHLRQMDDSIYAHSINVALIARILGTWLKYDRETLDMLTVAGLLHDIGKIKVPESILNKPGKLSDTEFEIVRMHPKLGYDSLQPLNIESMIKDVVLHHHERCDGSGYPDKLSGDALNDFVMVIAVADVYDAMTAARKYRAPMCPFEVIASFENEGLQKYKPHVILTFLERIANTYQNCRVMLESGEHGTVVLLNNNHLSKPIVKLDDESFLDLSTCSDRIVSIL